MINLWREVSEIYSESEYPENSPRATSRLQLLSNTDRTPYTCSIRKQQSPPCTSRLLYQHRNTSQSSHTLTGIQRTSPAPSALPFLLKFTKDRTHRHQLIKDRLSSTQPPHELIPQRQMALHSTISQISQKACINKLKRPWKEHNSNPYPLQPQNTIWASSRMIHLPPPHQDQLSTYPILSREHSTTTNTKLISSRTCRGNWKNKASILAAEQIQLHQHNIHESSKSDKRSDCSANCRESKVGILRLMMNWRYCIRK